MPTRRIDILTLFPEMFEQVLNTSILKRAATPVANPADPSDIRPPVVSYHLFNFRDHTNNKHDKVDKPPYGGGPGMVIQCQPIWDCLKAAKDDDPNTPITPILMTPTGKRLDQPLVEKLADTERLTILCGHYEGFDQRVVDRIKDEYPNTIELSVGDYVLSGGEPAAIILTDAVVRLLPGVLGDADSAAHESFSKDLSGGLDYPHYTRPSEWEGRAVPGVLKSGDHAKIEAWRREQSDQLTRERRPDILNTANPSGGGLVLRPEMDDDLAAVDALLKAAFKTADEARLVRVLRAQGKLTQSWVAESAGHIVGHLSCSTPGISTAPTPGSESCTPESSNSNINSGVYEAIAPVCVAPQHQGRGIGSALIRQAIRTAEAAGVDAVFVLGKPGYYKRFGFEPASKRGIGNPFGVDETFMALELTRNGLASASGGTMTYAAAFNSLPQ